MVRNEHLPKAIVDLQNREFDRLAKESKTRQEFLNRSFGGIDDVWKEFSHFIHNVPGINGIALVYDQERDGKIQPFQVDFFAGLLEQMALLMCRAVQGDEIASLQIDAAHKMLFRGIFNLERGDIEKVAKLDKSNYGGQAPSLRRGYELRRIMAYLSSIVRPKDYKERMGPSTLIKLTTDEKKIALYPDWYVAAKKICEAASARELAGMTLFSLAKKIYLPALEKIGFDKITDKELDADLRIVESRDNEYDPLSNEWVTYFMEGYGFVPVRILSGKWMMKNQNEKNNENKKRRGKRK